MGLVEGEKTTEDMTTTCWRLVELICTGTMVEEFSIQQKQKQLGMPTTASSLGGVEVNGDKINDEVTIMQEFLRHRMGY